MTMTAMPADLAFCFDRLRQDAVADVHRRSRMPAEGSPHRSWHGRGLLEPNDEGNEEPNGHGRGGRIAPTNAGG